MRYVIIVKALLCLLWCISLCRIEAAEYRNGQLWLEVLLASGTQMSISSSSGSPPLLYVSERNSPISRELAGNLSIKLINEDKLAYWGFLNGTEPWTGESAGVLKECFAWEDSNLVIKRENLLYAEESFSFRENARRYALEAGIPEQRITPIPLINATVRITAGAGEYYFETPLAIHSTAPVSIGGVQLGYEGEFVLKTVQDRIVVTHLLPLEDYIAGVIQNEIGNNAPLEALKVQAVAARTHAVSLLLYNRHTSDGYDLCNSTHCQVYKGKYLLNDAVRAAVDSTRSEVLLINGRIADATYHSACGGKTDSSAGIWNGDPLPHLMGVTCIDAAGELDLSDESQARRWIDTELAFPGMSSWERASLTWSKTISRQALAANLGMKYVSRVVINQRGSSGRITDITFHGSKTVRLTSEYKIRQAFGSAMSSFFYIRGNYVPLRGGGAEIPSLSSNLIIRGKGSGHGVGMCQVGTLRRAREGASYRDILAQYYPGTVISSNWRNSGG